jgi:acyl carrier protein
LFQGARCAGRSVNADYHKAGTRIGMPSSQARDCARRKAFRQAIGAHGIDQGKSRRKVMSTMMAAGISDEDILSRLRKVLHDTFEIEPTRVTPAAHLFTDLELDSIDAVDLAIQVQDMTGMRIKPEDFKNVRTVGDVIATVHSLLDR